MKECAPEKQYRSEINTINDELAEEIGRIFDNKEEINGRIDGFVSKLDLLQREGLIFDREEIIKGLRESVDIKDREVFISHLLKVLEPILEVKATYPEVFEKVQREFSLTNQEYLKLSEVLYFDLDGEEARIHLGPATELIKEKGIGNFRKEIENGLHKLAEIIKSNNNVEIKEITAISWIVAKNPLLIEKLGFTTVGEIQKDEKRNFFPNEKRPIAKAFMERGEFLARYGN